MTPHLFTGGEAEGVQAAAKYTTILMMSKKSPVSHTVPTHSIPDQPNTKKEEDLTKSTSVVPVKNPPKVKLEESSNNAREYEF